MSEDWYKLDNVAKVFLAAHSKRDPRALRVSATLYEDIDPEILQKALNNTMRLRPEFQVRIRRGFFWHYMEQTDTMPVVTEESERPCPILYGKNYRGILHYKVTYFRNRINIDMFHALSDGTGALSLLKLLTLNYLKLAHPGRLDEVSFDDGASTDDRNRNSYEQFYENTDGPLPKTILNKKKKAYHIQSRKLPYDQLEFFEIHMEAAPLLKRAKSIGVSLTSYLGAELMMALHNDRAALLRSKPITISLPVNLRNYYPSETTRNFFNNVDVTHVFTGGETVETLAEEFDVKLKSSIEPEVIRRQMNRYQSIERLFFTRMVPLAIKQPVVRFFSKKESKTVTAVLSNLGPQKLPQEMIPYVKGFSDFCSTSNLFITATTYGDDMVLGVASAYSGTGVIRRLIKALRANDSEVTVHASEVIR